MEKLAVRLLAEWVIGVMQQREAVVGVERLFAWGKKLLEQKALKLVVDRSN